MWGYDDVRRYVGRSEIRLSDGRIAYDLKRTWSDGSRAVVYEPLDFIAKLLPLLPPPGVNQIRFHGVLAPASSLRPDIVPAAASPKQKRVPANYSWAEMMLRVFELDVLKCAQCGGRMRWVATISDRETIEKLLATSGRPGDSPEGEAPKVPKIGADGASEAA